MADCIVKLTRTFGCIKAQNLLNCSGFINGANIPHINAIGHSESTRYCHEKPNTVGDTTMSKLFNQVTQKHCEPTNTVTVVGTGEIGMASVFALLAKNITRDVCMVDIHDDKLRGEQMDLQYGSAFLNNAKIVASKDHSASANSKIYVITAGTDQERDESRSSFISRNAGIMQAVIPPLVKCNPRAIFLVATEPVDIMTYLTWKISKLPKNQVIGTGTNLDTARFRYLLSERLHVSPSSCQALIIGGQGESSVPVWSGVNIAGVRLADIKPEIGTERDTENWQSLHDEVVRSEQVIRQLKGCNSWAVALSIADICEAILTNACTVRPLSTYVKGEHCIRNEIFLSLPCVVGLAGVTEIVRQQLSEKETSLLRKSAQLIADFQDSIRLVI